MSVPDDQLDHRATNPNAVPLGDSNPETVPPSGEVGNARPGERPSSTVERGEVLDSPSAPTAAPPAVTADPSVQVGGYDPDDEDPYEQAARAQAKAAKNTQEATPFDTEPGSKVAW